MAVFSNGLLWQCKADTVDVVLFGDLDAVCAFLKIARSLLRSSCVKGPSNRFSATSGSKISHVAVSAVWLLIMLCMLTRC